VIRAVLALALLLPPAAFAEPETVRYHPIVWKDCPSPFEKKEVEGALQRRVRLISPYELKDMLKRGDSVEIVDVRSSFDFGNDHLAGARNMPLERVSTDPLRPETMYVLYCGICCCPEVPIAAKVLLDRGVGDIAVLRAGLEETGPLVLWKQRDSLIEQTDNFIQLECGAARTAIKRLKKKMELEEIPPIEFEFNSAKLRDYSKDTLDEIFDVMDLHPGLRIKIHGHTCDIGGREFNYKLSLRRAAAVKNYLVRQGIDETMIVSRGFGESKPVVPNDSEENRELNRRVEFYWLKGRAKSRVVR
jgi:outer membrane protein OmpA-like peptidoglycan-associated protein